LGSFPPKNVGQLRLFWSSGVFEKYITKSGVFETFSVKNKSSPYTLSFASALPKYSIIFRN
jgi:hypothetical protein